MAEEKKKQAAPEVERPRGDYKMLDYDRPSAAGNTLVAAYFPDLGQFAISSAELSRRGRLFVDNEDAENPFLYASKVHRLSEKLPYLNELMRDFGYHVYAVFLVGEIGPKDKFEALDIYAGVAGEGHFLPTERLGMFLEQIDIPLKPHAALVPLAAFNDTV